MTPQAGEVTASVVRVRIDEILRHRRFQVRVKLDPGTIDRYRCAYASEVPMPPIKVALVNGAGVLVDGFHRVAALEALGVREVEAEIVEATEREAFWLAAEANLTHGLPLKTRELQAVFKAYIRARRHRKKGGELRSYREIARDLGGVKSYQTIRRWMLKYFPKIAKEMGGNEEFTGTGGLPLKEPEVTLEATVWEALQHIRTASRGVTDPSIRGAWIALCEEALTELKDGGPWTPSDFNCDF